MTPEPDRALEPRSPSSVSRALAWPFMALIRFYQRFISPLTPPTCRFYPTCSHYGLEAFRVHGPFKGAYLTVWRILRCNPWGGSGFDPVPGSELDARDEANPRGES